MIFSNDRKTLLEDREKIKNFLKNKLALELHDGKSQIYQTRNGIKFLGFRIFNNYRRLASDNVKRFRKRIKKFVYLFENTKMDADEVREFCPLLGGAFKICQYQGIAFEHMERFEREKWAIANLLRRHFLLDGITDISEREKRCANYP